MRYRPLVLLSLLLLTAVQLIGAGRDRVTFYYNIAEGNYLIGDQTGAERSIEQSLRLNPTHAPSLALKAKIQLDQSQPEAALEAVTHAIASDPEELEYLSLKALILGQLDRRDEAIALTDAILEKAEPGSEVARSAQKLQGLLNMAEQRWDEAAAAFRSTYETGAESSASGRQLATEAYLEKARTAPDAEQALAAIDQAIELYADTTGTENLKTLAKLQLTRAKLLTQKGQVEQAIHALQRLLGQNPDNLEAAVTLASIYASREEWLALEDLIAPIAKNPQLADIALYLEGRVALSRNRVGTARAKFEEALQLNVKRPTELQPTLEFYRSICFEKLGSGTQAEKSLQQAIDGGYVPETAAAAVHLGRLLLRMEEEAILIPTLEKALLRGNANSEAWAILGRAHIRKDQNTLAISALNQSLALDPNNSGTLALRGSLLRRIGDLKGALADYARARHLNPDSSAVLSYEQGLVLLQLGRIHEAEPLLSTAAHQLADQPTLHLLHASCAYALGDFDAARSSLETYLHQQKAHAASESSELAVNDTAAYLHTLLSAESTDEAPTLPAPSQAAQLFAQYTRGEATRKQVLDWAGRAASPEQARRQICSTAFWLAQYERQTENNQAHAELLEIATNVGSPENPEYQFAQWQLAHPSR